MDIASLAHDRSPDHHAPDHHAPNHHAHHPGFSGPSTYLAVATMRFRRPTSERLAIDLAGVGPGDVAVDIGCGAGNAVRIAARRGATATGVDPSPEMLRMARVLSFGRRTTYRPGSAEALPIDDAGATVAWSVACVHHWPDLEGGLGEVRRVLRPGGRFVAIERRTTAGAQGLASHGWTPEQAAAFADRCRVAGFVDVVVGDHPRGRHDQRLLAVVAHQPD